MTKSTQDAEKIVTHHHHDKLDDTKLGVDNIGKQTLPNSQNGRGSYILFSCAGASNSTTDHTLTWVSPTPVRSVAIVQMET